MRQETALWKDAGRAGRVLVRDQESCPAVSPGWSSPSQSLAWNAAFPRPAAAEKVSPPPEITDYPESHPCRCRASLPSRPREEIKPTPPKRRIPPVQPHRSQTKTLSASRSCGGSIRHPRDTHLVVRVAERLGVCLFPFSKKSWCCRPSERPPTHVAPVQSCWG